MGSPAPPRGSQRPHLEDVDLRGLPGLRGHVQLVEVVAGDDEDDGGGAEGHPLLGPLPAAAARRPRRHDRSDGAALHRSHQGALFEAAGEPRAEQPQQAAPELKREERELQHSEETMRKILFSLWNELFLTAEKLNILHYLV